MSCTLAPSANEQHSPLPLASRSNHCLSGQLAYLPSSPASSGPGTIAFKHNPTATKARLVSLRILASSRSFRADLERRILPIWSVRRAHCPHRVLNPHCWLSNFRAAQASDVSNDLLVS